MTVIDFYTHCADRFEVASKLVAKAWAQHGSVRVLTDGEDATAAFGFLWLWPGTGFSHCRLASPIAGDADLVDHGCNTTVRGRSHQPSSPTAAFFARFERMARESSDYRRESAAAGRDRWKFCKALAGTSPRARPFRKDQRCRRRASFWSRPIC
jgi:DNA polymerase-3 subunit chi